MKLNIRKSTILLFIYYFSLHYLGDDGYYSSKKLVIDGWWWLLISLSIQGILLWFVRKEKSLLLHIAIAMTVYPLFRIRGKSLPLFWEKTLFDREQYIPIELVFGAGIFLLIYYFYANKMTPRKFVKDFSGSLLGFYYVSIFLFSKDTYMLSREIYFEGWSWILTWLGISVITLVSIKNHKNILLHASIGCFLYLPFVIFNHPILGYKTTDRILSPLTPLVLSAIFLALYYYRKWKKGNDERLKNECDPKELSGLNH